VSHPTCDVPFPPRRPGKYWKGMIPARPLYQEFRRSVWDPETSRERVGDWGGPETDWALLCVAERRTTRLNGEWGYSTRRHMLGPERPEAVSPERGVVLTDIHSHLLIVNKPLSLSPSLSLQPGRSSSRLGSGLSYNRSTILCLCMSVCVSCLHYNLPLQESACIRHGV